MKVNFSSKKTKNKSKLINKILIVFMVIIIVSLFLFYFYLFQDLKKKSKENKIASKKLEDQLKSKQKYIKLEQIKKSLNKEVQENQLQNSYFLVLNKISYLIPEFMWLQQIEIKENQISISGASEDNKFVLILVEKFNKTDLFKNCKISFIKKIGPSNISFKIKGFII